MTKLEVLSETSVNKINIQQVKIRVFRKAEYRQMTLVVRSFFEVIVLFTIYVHRHRSPAFSPIVS